MASSLALSAPTIIVVDDDDALLNALAFALEAEGFRVRSFRTAKSAYSAPKVDEAACMVIDQMLADEPGLELLARLRALGNQAPAVLITTNPHRAVQAQAARMDVPIVEKPLLGDQLFACIRRLIGTAASNPTPSAPGP